MKKILLGLLLATSALTMGTSCTKEYYEIAQARTFFYTVKAQDWAKDNNGLFKTIVIDELSGSSYSVGAVTVALSNNNGASYDDISTFDGRAYSFNYASGSLTLYAQDPILDPNFDVEVPETLLVKITIIDAEDRT